MDLHVGSANLLSTVTVPYGGLRLWDTGTGWAEINTSSTDFQNGTFDWTNLDAFVSAKPANVDLLYNLARTPTWASSGPSDSNCDYASIGGGPGQCHPPVDLNSDGSGTDQDWINWVTAVATRYKGQIKYYEIWNEWNIQLFWVGTPAQLVRMEQDARCVVGGPPTGKTCNPNSTFPSPPGIDPSAQIITPSPVGAATDLNSVASNLTTYFGTTVGGNAGGTFADIIGFHGYVGTTSSSGMCPQPENVNTVVDDMASVVNGTAGEAGKPWFDTEGGWSQAPAEDFTDPDRQAAFLPRYYLLQASLGVDRAYWYRWDSGQTYGGSLWTSSGGPTPAATAYGEVSKWIVGATLTNACAPVSGGSSVWTCGFSRGSYKALAVWDAGQDCLNGSCATTPFNIPSGGYTMMRDVAGNETTLSGSSTPIGAKPILLETGKLP